MINVRGEETTTGTGTGTLSLAGPPPGRRSIVNAIGTGKKVYYCIESDDGIEWEHGYGTITAGSPDTLTRTAVESSNGNALVDFSAGTKRVYIAENADSARFGNTGEIPTATGTANALVLAYSPPHRHRKANQVIRFFPAADNAGAVTIDDGPGAIALNKGDGSTALGPKDLLIGILAEAVYDETSGGRYILRNPQTDLSGRMLNIQYITATGTYTPTVGTKFIIAKLIGGAGSGSRSNSGQPNCGGGGGGYSEKKITSGFSGAAVTIGAGGAAVTADNTAGNDGGTTSFGAVFSATGGKGGVNSLNGRAAGGTGSGGDLNIAGSDGFAHNATNSGTPSSMTCGGASAMGYGGQTVGASVGGGYNGVNGKAYGGAGTGSSTGNNSGAGADGLCVIEEYS